MNEEDFSFRKLFREANEGLKAYQHIIGVGVMIFFIVFTSVFLYTYSQERKIAEKCGFENEKIKCVCTKEAWDTFNNRTPVYHYPKDLNIDFSLENQLKNGEEN